MSPSTYTASLPVGHGIQLFHRCHKYVNTFAQTSSKHQPDVFVYHSTTATIKGDIFLSQASNPACGMFGPISVMVQRNMCANSVRTNSRGRNKRSTTPDVDVSWLGFTIIIDIFQHFSNKRWISGGYGGFIFTSGLKVEGCNLQGFAFKTWGFFFQASWLHLQGEPPISIQHHSSRISYIFSCHISPATISKIFAKNTNCVEDPMKKHPNPPHLGPISWVRRIQRPGFRQLAKWKETPPWRNWPCNP